MPDAHTAEMAMLKDTAHRRTANSAERRLRILLSACAITPGEGSENGIGWNYALQLAKHHDVHVLAGRGIDNRTVTNYQAYCREHGPISSLTMHFVDQPAMSRWLQREGAWQRMFYYAGYASWQREALAVARKLHAQFPFDLAHHLTITGFREPGYLWKLPIPFFWGPVSGAQMMPWSYLEMLSRRDQLMHSFRNAINKWHILSKRRCRSAADRAEMIWSVDDRNARMVRKYFKADSEQLFELGCDPKPNTNPRRFDGSRPLNLIWSGIHEGRKCMPLLLHAMAKLQHIDPGINLSVLGQGSATRQWQRLANRLGISDQIDWVGFVPLDQAQNLMDQADVFVLTSLLEGSASVVMESLSLGLPVICHDTCGMGVAIDERCGIKVAMTDPQTSITGFAEAIRRLLEQPEQVEELSAGAIQRSHELTWTSLAEKISDAYRAAVPRVD